MTKAPVRVRYTPLEYMPDFTLIVDGNPKGQPRARASVVGGKFARMYTPPTAAEFKHAIRLAGKEAGLRGRLLEGPLRVDVTWWFARPKSHYRTGKRAHELRPDCPVWHTGKPDRDNCDKAVLDALTSIGAWRDDSQACAGEIQKKYSDGAPFTEIQITCLS